MEQERTEDQNKVDSSKPTGLPINWSLISQPVLPTTSMGAALPPPQSSSGHSLKNKVKSFTQRRMRARDREKDRDRLEVEVVVSGAVEPAASDIAPMRQRPFGKSLPGSSWRTHAVKNLYSSDEDDEVEVEVKLEIHSPPAEAKVSAELQEVLDTEVKVEEVTAESTGAQRGETAEDNQTSSRQRLPSETSSSSKDEQSNPPATPLSASSSTTSSSSTTTSASTTLSRHWAPPKGFWRVARPETLLLNGVSPQSMPMKDLTQIEEQSEFQRKVKTADTVTTGADGGVSEDCEAPSHIKHSDSLEGYLDKKKEFEATKPAKSEENSSDMDSAEEKLSVKQRAYAKLRERQQICRELREQSGRRNVENYGEEREEGEGPHDVHNTPDPAILMELEPYLRTLLLTTDELPLSPRHEQAKRLLERARLKARSNHIKDDRLTRRSHSDQRSPLTKPVEASDIPTVQKVSQTKDDLTVQTSAGPLLVPDHRETSPSELASRSRRYGCSPTRVRFEDESEKEAESRYLDRVRQRGRPGFPKSKQKEINTDSSSSGSERSRTNRSISVPAPQKLEDVSAVGQVTTVIKEIIVVVKKCEACGSVVREPQNISVGQDLQNVDPQLTNQEDPRGKPVPRWVPPNKPEVSTRPKAPLTVTFAGAYVLGESKESSTGWKSSGFGKLRRRSRKGESRLESGHGPYGPSWAQRRNSNPRNRGSTSRAVSFAPDSPVTLEPRLLGASAGQRDSPAPVLPIKSALKSSSRNRTTAVQSTVQFQKSLGQGDGNAPHLGLLDSPEALSQGTPSTNNQLACIRPSTLRYSPARLATDVPTTEIWDATPDGAVGGDPVSGSEGRAVLRGLALSRTDDLRAELLRAEHLKAEAMWEENSDGSRKLDGRSKPFLRRFFSSIGLNSVGRLVKGARSSSMEQLSLPAPPRVSSASPSPTRRPHPTIRIQRTPSLQTLNTVLPLAQLRKASSVQSLERRTERTTILGEVQIPYGLAPSPDSPQLELHRALSVEEILTTRMVLPVGRVTQVFPDGTLLLELIRPPNGPFGFVISRGKGRPDTGVYVEKVGDGSGESPYVGLLGNGDEILQVNGEAVAGLSLEQVTWLMTRESVATLRIMPARRK